MDNKEALAILEDLYNRKINDIECVTKKQNLNNNKECEALKISIDNLKREVK